MTSLKKKTISGFKWTIAASIIQRVISFGVMLVLARILSPSDFGLYSLAFVVINAFGIFKSLGFDSALVRQKENLSTAYNTAFILIPLSGITMFVLLFVTAPQAARFLNNSEVEGIIKALGFIFVIGCFSKIPQTVLYKEMRFKERTIAELAATTSYSVLAVVLALMGFGVWSLVVAFIVKSAVQGGMEWIFAGWRPKFEFNKDIAWRMFHFGKYLLGSSIIYFLYRYIDKLTIGKMLGVAALGYYSMSLNMARLLNEYFFDRFGAIMFPAYSTIQEEDAKIQRIVLRGIRYVSILALPFCVGLFLFAHEIIIHVLGEKWLPAEGVLRIVCFSAFLSAMASPIWPAFMAKGKSKIDFVASSIQLVIFSLMVIPFAKRLGAEGAGWAVFTSTLIGCSVAYFRARHMFKLNFSNVMSEIKLAVFGTLIFIISVLFAKNLFGLWGIDPLWAAPVGVCSYAGIVYLQDKKIISEIKSMLV